MNPYLIGWSIMNFLLLLLIIAIPIVCIILLVKMNRRLKRMEEEIRQMTSHRAN
jgi:hypothetical protein